MKLIAKAPSEMSRKLASFSTSTVLLVLLASPALGHDGDNFDDNTKTTISDGAHSAHTHSHTDGNLGTNSNGINNINNINVNVNTNNSNSDSKTKKRKRFFKPTSTIGFGSAKPNITSGLGPSDHEGRYGLSLGIGTMASFSSMFHLTAGGDYIFGKGSSSDSESRTLLFTAGFVFGKVIIPGSVYFSGASGPARTSLSNEFFGGGAPKGAGKANKMALGRILDKNTRVELSYLRIKDEWDEQAAALNSGDYEYKAIMLNFVHHGF